MIVRHFLDQSVPSLLDCAFYSVFNQPPGYEEASCTASELDSPSIKQCCEQSNNAYLCTTCGSCAGENTAGNPAAPGQVLVREDKFNQTCCSYSKDRGALYYRNGTTVTNFTTGEVESCDDRDDAVCCKVGNGAANDQYACFYPIELDDSVPNGVENDDNCVCAMLSVNMNNGGDLEGYLGQYCQERIINQPSSAPTQMYRPSSTPTQSSKPTETGSSLPSLAPSQSPAPTSRPSQQPSSHPSAQTSSQPSTHPSNHPSTQPTTSSRPSLTPSISTSGQPSATPSTSAPTILVSIGFAAFSYHARAL